MQNFEICFAVSLNKLIQWTVKLLVIQDAMMLMWHHWDAQVIIEYRSIFSQIFTEDTP